MDLRKIEYFLAAVEYGSFTQAAKNCNISQTAISQQIQSIENELGIQLFDRSEYRAKLTFAGKKFCRRCKHIINDYYNAVEEIKSLENGYSGNINIGISGIIEKSFLQKILQSYSQNNPNINIELKENNPNNLVENAKKNNLDIV
ncbi:MAG: LysR family transcriptional regulator, partial [Paraclostridium sp.]